MGVWVLLGHYVRGLVARFVLYGSVGIAGVVVGGVCGPGNIVGTR